MLKYLLLSALIAVHTTWAKPAVHHHGELAPHVVIVTPQAQLQLESFAHGTPIIQHLSPFTRFVSPHEETVIYVPTNAIASRSVASVHPAYQYEARSVSDSSARQGPITASQIYDTVTGVIGTPSQIYDTVTNAVSNPNQIYDTVATGITNAVTNAVVNAAQNNPCDALNSVATNSPQSWGENIAGAIGLQGPTPAANADTNEAPIKAQSDLKAASSTYQQQLPLTKIQHIEYEIPITPILAHEPRHQHQHYASIIGPTLPHVVDFIQAPIFLSPSIPTIKGRSLEVDSGKPIIAIPLPEAPKPEDIPLKFDINRNQLPAKKENIPEIRRFLEANALKDGQSFDTNILNQIKEANPEAISSIPQTQKLESEKPELKTIFTGTEVKEEQPQPQPQVA